MTGGAGFSRSAIESSRENRNLRKVRPSRKEDGTARKISGSDTKSLSESIQHQHSRRTQELKRKSVFYALFFIALLFSLILLWFFRA